MSLHLREGTDDRTTKQLYPFELGKPVSGHLQDG